MDGHPIPIHDDVMADAVVGFVGLLQCREVLVCPNPTTESISS